MSGKDTSPPFRFAIVGGGICGLTLAIAMARRGLAVDIYEQASSFREIGAGVAFGPNSLQALELCSPDIYKNFQEIVTGNRWPEKKRIWFTYVDGYTAYDGDGEKFLFDVVNDLGAAGVHRANFLDQMVKLVPQGVAHFGKCLRDIEEAADGSLSLRFTDGSAAAADAVIGCDGIKSRVRQIMVGPDNPAVAPTYSHKYAYRGLIPVEKMEAAVGADVAANCFMHIGKDAHVLTFPVAHGKYTNIVAFRTNPEPWPDHSRLTLPSTKAAALHDFREFGPVVHTILNLLSDDLDRWGIFDSWHAPLASYCKGRVCVLGDAAHASSPHQGAGAGVGVEDAAVMAELLSIASSKPRDAVAAAVQTAFAVFDAARRERTQWLVNSSRIVGDLYEWRAEGIGEDIGKIEQELKRRCRTVWDVNVATMVEDAKAQLHKKL